MEANIVNLNVNPCKMCMPMGAVSALYGIKKCMSILHGSQGCSTYIRRHMATHYNEPVDIASSSLTEQGTVYGGEENLLKGLKNLITLYNPEVIGVATTCLAETIGEDIVRIIGKFYELNPEYKSIKIIPVHSAGYAGSQYEGFISALIQIVKAVDMEGTPNNKVNVVTSMISPADTRYLKQLLEAFGIDYILLPDLSENLDGGHKKEYDRLPQKGTSIEDIKKMAGARFTIELSSFMDKDNSVAQYLYDTYGVEYQKLPVPIGLRDNDALIELLSKLSGKSVPESIKRERARYIDAMIDSHKYNGEGRAVIYGEPDFVYSTLRLCVENGVMPLISATGSNCTQLKPLAEIEIQPLADSYFIDNFEILDDVDFLTIEESIKKLGANMMIGNSDGRRIEDRLGIKLVRRAFPIHDRVGGQRLRTMGYSGSLEFLDEITNVLLSKKEVSFREDIYNKYYKEEKKQKISKEKNSEVSPMTIEEKTATHPCYNCGASDYARIHLPVAPKCNISCNYCVRKYDCPNESRPGVTTNVLDPQAAFEKYLEVKKRFDKLSVVGIAGPGDALANFEETKKTLELIREHDKDVTFCLSTNGLMLPTYANDLIELGVSHVTVTMNSIDPKIGAKIYKYVDYMGVKYTGEAAAAVLMANQLAGIKMLTTKGIICKVNIVMLKGINDEHIPEVVKKVKELGGFITNIMQLIPVKGSVFENLEPATNIEIMEMRKACGQTMKQMYHCKQCRADAIGTLGNDVSIEFNSCSARAPKTIAEVKTEEIKKTVKLAVASKSGMIVDQHFGQVSELYIYEYTNNNLVFKEKRTITKYCSGSENCEEQDKIISIINTIADCDGVIAMRIGEAPKQKLAAKGIRVYTTYDRIEQAVEKAALEMLA